MHDLSPGSLGLAELETLYRSSGPFRIDDAAMIDVARSADRLAAAVGTGEAIYGVNTGFGKLASVRIGAEDLGTLQRNLVLSHSAGFGEPLAPEIVRFIIALKCLSLGRGASGVRPVVVERLQQLVEADVIPVVPEKGSVGASGDLAPLAHVAATLIGEGVAFYKGERMAAGEALQRAALEPLVLEAKEGLALLNGTQVSTGLALAALFDSWRLAVNSLVTTALSLDAAMGSTAPFREEIHTLRGHRGQIVAAEIIRDLLEGSQIRESHREDDLRVQDPYCLRCAPQVIGACLDQLAHAGKVLRIEANAATDNPLVLSDGSIVSGGNFHAEPVGMAADGIAIAVSEIGAIAQRRIALLVDPALSFGLPAFLAPSPGLQSGLMIAEVTSAALMSENKALANPRVVDSTPTSANQEDHVSMACHGARRLFEMNANLAAILGIEAMTAAQGVECRAPLETSATLQATMERIRAASPALTGDRLMEPDIAAMADLLGSELLADGIAADTIAGFEA
ncbi:histidine ammonia-lyase [Altererythrobacter arenosus]|uniref:Histidine ammonia-lyase n=1 Tax=Altererythrobacter arenosus TaxID=3032592 RepID=A0ABY8FN05_9SPHN|nr:histidine ammonia-lyase [Altererythrobacter sp. CAU 1644]WFL76410.1 histidine ammonia-lyase [Altererythrobacter sp. CAU 1644]